MFKVGDIVRFKQSEGLSAAFTGDLTITQIEPRNDIPERSMIYFKKTVGGGSYGGYFAYRFVLVQQESKETILLNKIKYLNERYQKRNLNVALG